MKREAGLRRTALITGALVAFGVTGTAVVGVAAYASDQSASESDRGTTSGTSPTLTSGGDSGSSAATSGGS